MDLAMPAPITWWQLHPWTMTSNSPDFANARRSPWITLISNSLLVACAHDFINGFTPDCIHPVNAVIHTDGLC